MNRKDSLEWHLHCMDDRLNNLQISLGNYNSYMCNEIAISDRYWSIVSAVLAILAIILGIYITYKYNKTMKLLQTIEKKEKAIKDLKKNIEDLNNKVNKDLTGLYESLRKEETHSLIKRLTEVPEDVSNIINLLLSRQIEKDDFINLKKACDKLEPNLSSYKKDYTLLFYQHFSYESIKNPELRKEFIENFEYLIGCGFKNDIIKSTDDMVNALSELSDEIKMEVVTAYYKSLEVSKYKDMSEVFEKLKSIMSNEQWALIAHNNDDENEAPE